MECLRLWDEGDGEGLLLEGAGDGLCADGAGVGLSEHCEFLSSCSASFRSSSNRS